MNQDLLLKYLDNTASDEEMREVLRWLQSNPENRKELHRLDKIFAASVMHGVTSDNCVSSDNMSLSAAHVGSHRGFRKFVRYGVEMAAAVIVAVGVAWGLTEHKFAKWSQHMTSLEVPAGQQLRMELEDGTDVWLSAGSRLEYPAVFADKERRVRIEGEAMFDVEHDEEHPFIVETFACDVKVLGTRFDIVANADEGVFSTALLRGSVEVTNKLLTGERYMLKPNDKIHLEGNRLHFGSIENPDDYLWTEGLISIKGQTFGQLMRKFEQHFGVDIVIERNDLPDIDYNYGKIRISDGIETALQVLQRATKFDYVRNENDGTIYIR